MTTMKLTLLILTLTIMSTSIVSGQDIFIKNKKTGHLKKLKPTANFGFDMIQSDKSKRLSYFGSIIDITDSTITVREYVKPSMHWVTAKVDTINISQIRSIKNYLFDNDGINTVGAMLIIGGAIGLIATPIVWIAEGQEQAGQAAIITAGLFAAGGLFLLPQLIGQRRHMTKWEFVKR